jgi:hypothetical protein
MSHKISCVITGKTITVSNEYYEKKCTEYGSEDKFNSLYVSRQVKNLLKRGYKVKEIRNLLKIDDSSVQEITDSKVKDILKVKDDDILDENVSIKKSDPDVVNYIKNLHEYLSSKTVLETVGLAAGTESK